jgi:hypothetical protein
MYRHCTTNHYGAVCRMSLLYVYECRFCGKEYKKEEAFRVHYCEERKRNDLLKTKDGYIAFALYEKWMQMRFGKIAIDDDRFKKSRMFNGFIRFAKLYRKIKGLNDIDEFLKLMVSKNILPTHWVKDCVVSYYLDHIDKKPPLDRISRSVDTLFKLADAYECDVSEIFLVLEFSDVVDFVKMKELSPWLLLNSSKFHRWLDKRSEEQQLILEGIVDSIYWSSIFKKNPNIVATARKCCTNLGI